jgi:transposase
MEQDGQNAHKHPGKALGNDVRSKIIDRLVRKGADPQSGNLPRGLLTDTADVFTVDRQTVKNVWDKYCASGSLQPLKHGGGHKRKLCDDDVSFIELLKREKPCRTYKEIQSELLQHCNLPSKVSLSVICRTVKKRLSGGDWTYKKAKKPNRSRFTDENMRYTQAFIDYMHMQDPYKLKFMDESGLQLSSAERKYGLSVKGTPCVDTTRYANSPNATVNLLLGIDGVKHVQIENGASDTDRFVTFIMESVNAYTEEGEPALSMGDILVVDNCPIHHHEADNFLRNWLGQMNIGYVFTPTYSPDFNPAECCFSKMKSVLKQEKYERLLKDGHLHVAAYDACSQITAHDTRELFRMTEYIDA